MVMAVTVLCVWVGRVGLYVLDIKWLLFREVEDGFSSWETDCYVSLMCSSERFPFS